MSVRYVAPRVPISDPATGMVTPIWYRFFSDLFEITGGGEVPDGESFFLESDGASETISRINTLSDELNAGGITPVPGGDNVFSISFGATGLTPSSPAKGVVTVDGVLVAANGGSGASTLTGYLKGNGTSPFTASATIPAGDVVGTAITKTNDTNVTLTLGGAPTTAVLTATSFTLGWTGTLAETRGGTGFSSYIAGDLIYAANTTTLARLGIGTVNTVLRSNGSLPSWGKVALTTDVSGVLPIANGGSNSSAALTGNAVMVSNAGGTSYTGATNLLWNGSTLFVNLTSSLGTGALHVRGGIVGDNSGGDANFNIEARSGGGGTIFSNSIYNSTTATGASVCITGAAGFLQRSTSSIKYKTDVEDLEPGLSRLIYAMRPAWYRSLCETDRKDWSYYGLIAEEVAEIEPRLVHWGPADPEHELYPRLKELGLVIPGIGPDGEPIELWPEGVMYDRAVVLLIAEMQRMEARITELERNAA